MTPKNVKQSNVRQVLLTSEDFVEIFSNKFRQEWDGKTTSVPYSRALRDRGGHIMITSFPVLPDNPGMDSLIPAYMALMHLEGALNDQIDKVNESFRLLKDVQQLNLQGQIHSKQNDIFGQYNTSVEVLAYIMKTTVDKLICLMSIAKHGYDEHGSIIHDSIGSILDRNATERTISNKTRGFCDGALVSSYRFLFRINDIHNAYKHTFSTTQISVMDNITPTMATIYKPRNSTRTASRLAFMLCYDAVQEFETLLKSAREYLDSLVDKSSSAATDK